MSNIDNLSPDEIRLLDEFAKAALQGLTNSMERMKVLGDDDIARASYESAAAMIAERRKRVPAQQVAVVLPTRRMEPPVIESTPPADGDDQLSDDELTEGNIDELTEDNINGWRESATVAPERGDYILGEWEIDHAVALMREGLAAKQELGETKRAHSVTCAELVKLAAEMVAAQPVLDAVAEFGWGAHEKACLARELLANYADRRRNEERAKQQGGA